MKLIKLISLALIVSISFTNGTHAQILKKLKKKVQQAAEQTVIDKTAEKAAQETGKAMDSLLDVDPDYQAKDQEQLLNKYMSTDNNISVEDVYTFDTNVIMNMVVEDPKHPMTYDYSMWFTNNSSYMATEIKNMQAKNSKDDKMPKDMLTVIDDKNQVMLIIMETQKMAQIISMEKVKDIADQENLESDAVNDLTPEIKQTGKSKKILGYQCEEFETLIEEGKMTFWITQDIRLFQKNMFENLNTSLGGNPFQSIPEAAKGFMMEMHFESQLNGSKTSMYVKDISKKKKTINVKDYQLMNLSGLMKN
ncbi:MAG: DUF4412 domain-containing protein [Flavobacteriaceae bacterium]|nr:DUF4412 domain-containing protein [Flavobacteriaceae bacterium]